MRSNGRRDAIVVDGQSIAVVDRPTSPQEVADVLRDADGLRQAVLPVGGGTKLALGNPPEPIARAIDMTALDRVIHFEPADLTLSVEAGARFGDVQRQLAERGQGIPLEMPDDDHATIGGAIATALAGPRRLGSGSLRDLLIGISVAYPSGIVAKAGGLVVKNVTGFDLMRLHHGALGTLGVIVSANFKTMPLHRAEATVLLDAASLAAAFDSADRIRSSRVRPLALEIAKSPTGYALATRIAGRAGTVELLAREAMSLLGASAKTMNDEESQAWWRAFVQAQRLTTPERVLIRCGASPRETRRLALAVADTLAERALTPDSFVASPGLGALLLSFPAANLTAKSLAGLQAALLAVAGQTTVLTAPVELKTGLDVWGRQPETLPVMRALKAEFDPNRILNPGRFVGRI